MKNDAFSRQQCVCEMSKGVVEHRQIRGVGSLKPVVQDCAQLPPQGQEQLRPPEKLLSSCSSNAACQQSTTGQDLASRLLAKKVHHIVASPLCLFNSQAPQVCSLRVGKAVRAGSTSYIFASSTHLPFTPTCCYADFSTIHE